MPSYDKRRALQMRAAPLISVSEVRRLKQRIAEEKAYLSSFGGTPEGNEVREAHLSPKQSGRPVDEESVRTRIRRNERALQAMSPENRKIKGRERQQAVKEMRGHELWLKKHMLTTYEMGAYPSSTDIAKDRNYRNAVDKSFKQEVGNPEFQRRASRYKELARRLEPDDPELPNIERLRPKHRY